MFFDQARAEQNPPKLPSQTLLPYESDKRLVTEPALQCGVSKVFPYEKPHLAKLTANDLQSNAQLAYFAEIPVSKSQDVYYSDNEIANAALFSQIKTGRWVEPSMFADPDSVHKALGLFKAGHIDFWEMHNIILFHNMQQHFVARQRCETLQDAIMQYPLFEESVTSSLEWSPQALNLVVGAYRRYLKEDIKSNKKHNTLTGAEVKKLVNEKINALKQFIFKNCPSNQLCFIVYDLVGFNLIATVEPAEGGYKNDISDNVREIAHDYRVANLTIMEQRQMSFFLPLALFNVIGKFMYGQDFVTPLPKLGILNKDYFYGDLDGKYWARAFHVESIRPTDCYFSRNINHLSNPHGAIASLPIGCLVHDLWHCLGDSKVGKQNIQVLNLMALAIKERTVEIDNEKFTAVEEELLDREKLYIVRGRCDSLPMMMYFLFNGMSVTPAGIGNRENKMSMLLIFHDMAARRQFWIQHSGFDPYDLVIFGITDEPVFPYVRPLLEMLSERIQQGDDFYQCFIYTLVTLTNEIIKAYSPSTDKLSTIYFMANLLNSLAHNLGKQYKGLIKSLSDMLGSVRCDYDVVAKSEEIFHQIWRINDASTRKAISVTSKHSICNMM